MENPGNQSEEAVEDPPPPTVSTQEQSTSESSSQQQQERRPPPPLSPLTGSYLLIVVGEPHSERHKEIILQKIAKAFLSWDVSECHVSLEKELQVITGQSPEGEEARYGERLIQYATENLVTEILIHPQLNTLHQCLKNLLSSFTKHRHIIHAGYTFAGNGSWILQDGTLSISDLVEALHEADVLRVLKAYENSVSIDVHCAPEGDWTTERFQKEPVSKLCNIRINPGDKMTAGNPAISAFIDYLSPFLEPANIQQLLQPTDVVGNIRFTHPTLYVFPGGQGDAALFGINGFNMLIDGGFARKACFWDFARHLDRLDAVLLTRLNNSTVNGISAVLQRKKMNHVYPQIGHFFCNLQDRKIALSPDGDKDKDSLIVNLAEEGQEIVANLRHLALKPHPCYRDGNQVDPVNLYHKVGHGKLDMYVISPARDSQAVKEFLAKWSSNDSHLFSNTGKKLPGKSFEFPLQNLVSICALLVWQPANPNDTITRILFPGSTPQHKIFEGLEKLRHLEFLKHPVCSAKSISPSVSTTTVTRSLSKTRQPKPADAKQKETKVISKPQVKPVKPKMEKTPPKELKTKLDNKLADEKNGLENLEEPLKKLDNRILSKDEQIENIKKEIQKIELAENEEQKKKIVHRSKYDMRNVKSKVDSRAPSKSIDRKKAPEKKPEGEASPPATPKKGLTNGTATKAEKSKVGVKPVKASSPTSTPAKSAKEANNRKVVEARVTTRVASTKAAPKKKEETPPPPSSAVAKIERKPISRRPKAPLSPAKSSAGKPKSEPEPVSKTIKKKTEVDTTVIKAVSQTIRKGLDKSAETEKTEEDEGKVEIKKLEEETTENKETDIKAVKIELDSAQTERNKEDEDEEEDEEEEEYLIITKEEYGEESAKEDESGKEEVQTKDETEGEGEIKKLLREEEESEKKRETQGSMQEEKAEDKQTEIHQTINDKTADDEKANVADARRSESPAEKTPEGRESELQRLMEVDEGIDLKEPVSKEHKEGESLPEEKMSNTLETSATTAPTLPEDERIEEPVEQEKAQLEDVKEVIEEKYIQEKTKEEKQEEVEVEPEQPDVPLVIDVEGSSIPRQPNQRKHPRDVVKTPDEVAELPVHEEVDPRMYSSGDFTKELQKKPEEEKQPKPNFKAAIKGEANFLDEDETESEDSKKPTEEPEQDQIQDPVITKYLNIIDELEKSTTDSKKDLEEKEPEKNQKEFTPVDILKKEDEVGENATEKVVHAKRPSVQIEDADSGKLSGRSTPVEKSMPLDLEKDVSGKSSPQMLDKQPSGKSSPQDVEKVASGKSTPLDLEKEMSGKSTPQELKIEPTEKDTTLKVEEPGISTPLDIEKSTSGKSTPQELEKVLSGKSTPLEKESSEKITSQEAEKIASGRSTPLDVGKDISGKSTAQDLEKAPSGKSTPLDIEKLTSGEDTPHKEEEPTSGKSTPVGVEKVISGKSTPQELEKAPSGKSTPVDMEKITSGKSTPQEAAFEKSTQLDIEKESSGINTPQDLEKVASGKSTPLDIGKALSGKSTPQEVDEIASGKSTPLDLGKGISGKVTSQDLEKVPSGKVTPQELEKAPSGKVTPQEAERIASGKSTPLDVEKITSGKSTPQDMEKVASGKITPQDLEKAPSGKSTPHELEKVPSGKITPEEAERIASGKITPQDLEKVASGKVTPQDLEKVPSGKVTPQELEKEPSGKITPEEAERIASGKITPEEAERIASGKITPQDLEKVASGKVTPQELEKAPSGKISLEEAERIASGKSTPLDIEKITSGKVTPQELEKAPSGKVTPEKAEKITSGKSTPLDVEKITSGKSTPQDMEKVASGKITPQDLEKAPSGKSTPHELEKVPSGKSTPLGIERESSGKSTPLDVDKVTSGKTTPLDIEKEISRKSTPQEAELVTSGKSTPLDIQKETSGTSTPNEVEKLKDVSGKTTPQDLGKISGKSTPHEGEKDVSGKITPHDSDRFKNVSGKSTPLDLDKISGKTTPSDDEKDISGKSTPHDVDRKASVESLPQDLAKETSGKATPRSRKTSPEDTQKDAPDVPPRELERSSPDKTSVKDLKNNISRESTPQDLNKVISGKSTPAELSKITSGKSTPQNLDATRSTPSNLEKEVSRGSTPLTQEELISGKSTPMELGKNFEKTDDRDISGKSTPKDLVSGKATPILKEKETSRRASIKDASGKSGTASPEELVKESSGKSTPKDKEAYSDLKPEKEIPTDSGKSTPKEIFREPAPQDVAKPSSPLIQQDVSGKSTPQEKSRATPQSTDVPQRATPNQFETSGRDSGRTTPGSLDKSISGKTTPEKGIPEGGLPSDKFSGKTTPADVDKSDKETGDRRGSQAVPGEVTPCEEALSGKSTRRESLLESSPIPSPQTVPTEPEKQELHKEEKTDEEKDKSGKTTPQIPKDSSEKVGKKPVTESSVSESVSSGPGEKDVSGKSTPFSAEVSGKISPSPGGKPTSDSFSLALAEKGTSGTYSLEKASSPSPVDISPLSLDELKDENQEKRFASPTQREGRKSTTESHGRSQLELLKYEEVGSSGTSTPDRSHDERSDASLPNGVESEGEPEKGILESERQEKESQILDISSGEEEELKALEDDEDSEPEIRKDDLEGRIIFTKDIAKDKKDDINKLVKVGLEGEEDSKTVVKRMLVTASSEDGGTETEICIKSGDKVVEEKDEETDDGDFTNLILQARKEYAQRSRKTSEEIEEAEERDEQEEEEDDDEKEEELGSLLKQARRELAFVRSKNKENGTVKSRTTTRSETTRMEDDDIVTITTILTEEREGQEDGRTKVTRTEETISTGGKDEGSVMTIRTNFERKQNKKQEDEESSSQIHTSGGKVSREEGEEITESSRRTSASSIISQEDLVSRKDSAKLEDFRQSSTEMSPLKTTYITSHGDSESLMTSSFYGNLPTEDEMIGRAEHLREFRKGRGYESFTAVGPNGERTERTYFYGSEDEPRSEEERSRFVKAYYTEGGSQKDGEQSRFVHRYYTSDIPEEEPVERTRFVQEFYTEGRSTPEGKFRFVETVSEEPIERMDFAKAVDEHVSARGEYLGRELQEDAAKYSDGKGKKETEDEKNGSEEKKDVIAGWGKPLGLPLPPKNKTYAFHGQNISTTSTLSTPTDNSDSVSNWGHPMNLPSPAPPPAVNGTAETLPAKATKETPKKEKKIQPKKNVSADNKSSGTNTPNRRSESPVKLIERRTPSTGRNSKSAGSHVYLDLTYVPHHGNSYYSNVEFFKKVRARYYVFSGTEPSKEVYNALLEAKQTWEDKKLEVTIIPTYDTDVLGYWVAENEEVLAKHKIDLSPSASRCTINLQDHETSCSAYRLEF